MVTGLTIGIAASSTVAVAAEVIRKKRNFFAVGDAQIDTAQYKFGGSSLYLDGSDYIEHTNSGLINTDNNGTVTIEMWVRPAATQAYNGLFDASPSLTGGIRQYGASGNLIAKVQQEASGASTGSFTAGTWTHLAVTFDNGVIKTYRDGTLEDTGSYTGGIEDKGAFIIGTINRGGAGYFTGHIDEFRISDNIRYTGSFTPSTTPFVNDDNTRCLLHFDGTDGVKFFEDDNGVSRSQLNAVGNGSTQIDTAQSYFGGSACLSTGSADSLLFDGAVIPLSGDFTVESWVRFTGTNSRKMLYSQYTTGTGRTSMEIGTDEKASFFCASQSSFQEADRILGDSALSVDTWYHIAVVRNSNTFTMYINGVAQADTISHSVNVQDQDFEIFGDDFGTHTDDVWQDEFRVSNTARYTTGFTPSTTPFVNDSNTLLLLHMNGTDGSTVFRDDNGVGRSAVPMIAKNNVQLDTTQSKFGGSSALFDGTNDYIALGADTSADQVATIPTTGEFTIECWVRFNTNTNYRAFVSQYGYNGQANPVGRSTLYLTNGNKFAFFINGGGAITGTTSSSTGVWYHIAATRDSSNVVRLFVNGTEEGTNFTSSAAIVDSYTAIGVTSNSLDFDMDGHIDEVRISNTARYTANFTAPTEPFQNDANTVFLTHFDGTDGSTDFTDDNGKESA